MSPNFLLKCRGSGARGAFVIAAAVALLAGCSTYDSLTQRIAQSITPYRITVVQGNFVSKEAAAKMHVGMTRAEVKAVLGTPLLTDMFHADRWDYLFYFKRGSTAVVQQRDFVVNFQGDTVTSWSGGDDLPSELELLADIDARFQDFSELDSRFHRLIAAVSPNRFIEGFQDVIAMVFHYHYQWNKRDERTRNEIAIREHLALIDALESRNIALIDRACRSHLTSARETLLRSIV